METTTAYTVSDNIIPYVIFRFHEKVSICRFHELRHTNVSLLFANTVDIRTIADIAGHAPISTTLNIYAHAMASQKQAAASKLCGALNAITQEAIAKKQQENDQLIS